MRRTPEIYVMHADGSLNALATKFFRTHFIVLFAELLEACGEDEAARDFVIGHEIGHLKAGHLRWATLLWMADFIPFLGHAYSRACEYTADRWGRYLCGQPSGAVRGLVVLTTGGKLSKHVNVPSFIAQENLLNTGAMTLGRWLSSYPPLSARVREMHPELAHSKIARTRGRLMAVLVCLLLFAIPLGSYFLFKEPVTALWQTIQSEIDPTEDDSTEVAPVIQRTTEEEAAHLAKVESDMQILSKFVQEFYDTHSFLPDDENGVLDFDWEDIRKDTAIPIDPFDGES
jgi:hypothetical protein